MPLGDHGDVTQSKPIDVYAVVPTLRNASSIKWVVTNALRFCDKVVVVDGGSDDETASLAAAAGAVVFTDPKYIGKGNALRVGFAHAFDLGARLVVTLDGDGQHNPTDIPVLMQKDDPDHTGNHIVNGSRFLLESNISKFAISRYLGNRIVTYAVARLLRIEISDALSGMRLYPMHLLKRLNLKSEGFGIDVELLIEGQHAGAIISEAGICANNGEKHQFIPRNMMLEVLGALINYLEDGCGKDHQFLSEIRRNMAHRLNFVMKLDPQLGLGRPNLNCTYLKALDSYELALN